MVIKFNLFCHTLETFYYNFRRFRPHMYRSNLLMLLANYSCFKWDVLYAHQPDDVNVLSLLIKESNRNTYFLIYLLLKLQDLSLLFLGK